MRTELRGAAAAASGVSMLAGMALMARGAVLVLGNDSSISPGPFRAGMTLALAGLAAFGIPAAIITGMAAVAVLCRYRAWKKTLTPAQRLAVSMAEFAAMWGMHDLWGRRNREEAERLTVSVMGEPGRQDGSPGQPF